MADVADGIFGTTVTKQGSKGKAETDDTVLCDSKHEVWVYTTDYLNDGAITPAEDNIIVSFVGTDTSGTGCMGAIVDGSMKFITDPEEWSNTVDDGMDIMQQKYDDGDASALEYYTYKGLHTFTSGASDYVFQPVGSAASWVWDGGKSVICGDSWYNLCAEEGQHMAETNYSPVGNQMNAVLSREFRNEGVTESGQDCFDDFGGTVFHNSNGRGHKVSVKITCDGETVYDTELAGTDSRTTRGNNMKFDAVNKSFKITKPGLWKVNVKSLASHSECGTPTLDKTWTISVSKPAGWDDTAPVIETQTEDVKEITVDVNTTLKDLGIESDADPLSIFAGLVLGGGILTWGLLSFLGSNSSEEEESDQ